MMCLLFPDGKMSLAQFFGIDKLQKLARMVKEHGGVKASLYHFYLTDDLKVWVQLGRNVISSGVDPDPMDQKIIGRLDLNP
jgi:hypothetical protein